MNGEKISSLRIMVCILLALCGVLGSLAGSICALELVRTGTRSHGMSTASEGVVYVGS